MIHESDFRANEEEDDEDEDDDDKEEKEKFASMLIFVCTHY